MSFLNIQNLSKNYGTVPVLKNISLEIEEGGFLVLVGPSGCGKSTLLNTIAGLEAINEGTITISAKDVSQLHPSERDIAMVFQSYALYPNMTVAGNIAFGMEMRGVPRDERDRSVKQVSDLLQIGHLLNRKPGQLSGGQRQRVAMGRALVRKPQVFLFDEPLSNLDAKLRVDMRTEIKCLHQRLKTTIVYVTHDQVEAMTLATKIAVLKDGVLQQFGSPAEIYNDPINMFVADFMGSPAMNLLKGKISVTGGKTQLMLGQNEERCVSIDLKQTSAALKIYKDKDVIFGIRPEALTDFASASYNGASIVKVNCLIEVVEPAGSDTFAITKLGGKEVVARLRADANVQAGQYSDLAFNLDKAVFFDPTSQLRIA